MGKQLNFFMILSMAMTIMGEIAMAASDGKITVSEAIKIITKAALALGLDLDDEGIDVSKM